MVSKIGITFLCCAALAAAVPFSPTKQSNTPSDADFDIIIVSFDGPESSESSENAFYDTIYNHFLNFQFPEFSGIKQFFSSEELFDETPEKREAVPEVKAVKSAPEVTEKPEVTVTVLPIDSPVITDNGATFLHPAKSAAFNFGLADLMSSIMNSVLTGFVQTLQKYEIVASNSSEVAKLDVELQRPDFEQILVDEPKIDDISEMEKKIEQLFSENDSTENDLKHGGALKAPKPISYNHEFHSAGNKENSEKDGKEHHLRGAVFPSAEQKLESENSDAANKLKQEKNSETELSSDEADLEFDRKILEILATFEDEIRKNQASENLVEKEPSTEVVVKDVYGPLPEAKTDRSVESQPEESDEEILAEIPPKAVSRIVRENTEVAPVAAESESLESRENDSAESMTYQFASEKRQSHPLPNFFSSEVVAIPAPKMPKPARNFNPIGLYGHPFAHPEYSDKYAPPEIDSEEFYGLSQMQRSRYDLPDFSDIIVVAAAPMPKPAKNFNAYPTKHAEYSEKYYTPEDFDSSEFYGFPQAEKTRHDLPDFSDIIVVAAPSQPPMNFAPSYGHYGHPVMAAYPHPFAPYLWPQPQMPAAGFQAHNPFDFLGHHVMAPHYFFM